MTCAQRVQQRPWREPAQASARWVSVQEQSQRSQRCLLPVGTPPLQDATGLAMMIMMTRKKTKSPVPRSTWHPVTITKRSCITILQNSAILQRSRSRLCPPRLRTEAEALVQALAGALGEALAGALAEALAGA